MGGGRRSCRVQLGKLVYGRARDGFGTARRRARVEAGNRTGMREAGACTQYAVCSAGAFEEPLSPGPVSRKLGLGSGAKRVGVERAAG